MIWEGPTGFNCTTCAAPTLPRDLGANSWWLSDTGYALWLERRADDMQRLRLSLGTHANATAIVYFPAFLADPVHGGVPLARLDAVATYMACNGVQPALLIGRPEFYGAGTFSNTRDVVHVPTNTAYLLSRVADILQLPAVQAHVTLVSVYWCGLASFCTHGGCSTADVTAFNNAIQGAVQAAGAHFKHLLHVDGPFWEGCWPQPCSPAAWSYNGYSPASMANMTGVLGESWTQGSLVGAVNTLLANTNIPRASVLLIQDVPNCDVYGSAAPCSTGALSSDVSAWFTFLSNLQLTPTWSVWNWVDGGSLDSNFYGAMWNNRSLTAKGTLLCRRAAQAQGLSTPAATALCI